MLRVNEASPRRDTYNRMSQVRIFIRPTAWLSFQIHKLIFYEIIQGSFFQ